MHAFRFESKLTRIHIKDLPAYFFHKVRNLLPVCKRMVALGRLSHLLFLAVTLKL